MKITKQDLIELIKEELDGLLSVRDPFAELDAETSEGIPLSKTEKGIDTKLLGKE